MTFITPTTWGRQKPPCGVGLNLADPLACGLAAFWPMTEASGLRTSSTLGDASQFVGSPTWKPSEVGVALDFDGSSMVRSGVTRHLGTAAKPDFSLFALICPRAMVQHYGFMGNPSSLSYNSRRVDFSYGPASNLRVGLGDGAAQYALYSPNNGLTLNRWQAVGFVRRGGIYSFWIDGRKVSSGANAVIVPDNSYPWTFGCNCWLGTYFGNLQMAAAGIWDIGLADELMRRLCAEPYAAFADDPIVPPTGGFNPALMNGVNNLIGGGVA
jgi:hypothetical protein